jgi:hypothetical protein
MQNTRRLSSNGLYALVAASLVASTSGGIRSLAAAPPQAVEPDATRQAYMQGHFAHVMVVHEAVIRGDLAAARRPASWLVTHEGPETLPEGAAPYVVEMRDAAGRTAAASSILQAALGTAAMLKICGDCHRAIGVKPATQLVPPRLAASGIVGHMLAHQHAADQMLQGLVAPSDALWREGAAGLSTPPLDDDAVPGDGKLKGEARASERRIHVLAVQARRAEAPAARAVFYGQILARCADCHAAHPKVWGPSRR